MANEDTQQFLTFRLLLDALGLSFDPVEIDDLNGSIIFVNDAWQ